jgi:hypothetical protein
MKACTFFVAAFIIFCNVGLVAQEFIIPETAGMNWYKGNTHSHSNQDVGSGSGYPDVDVALWYRNHGYQFLVMSDIINSTRQDLISKVSTSTFMLIPGLEIKSHYGNRWVHTNGLNTRGTIYSQEGGSLLATLQTDIDEIRAKGGVPQINHPRYMDGPDRDAILSSKNCSLMEIHNGYVGPKSLEQSGFLTTEMDWDFILTNGKQMYGLASDDYGKPGKGWVVVRASKLDAEEICSNLEKGLFYASTGVQVKDIVIEPKRMTIIIEAEEGIGYRTCFFGLNGRLRLATEENPVVFELQEDVKYVRAKVTSSKGVQAWIQPIFIRAKR